MEFVKTIVFALLIAVGVRTFAYEPFNIPSGSMIPNLKIGDYLFVSKLSYGYSQYSFPFALIPFSGRVLEDAPERGDVAVFRLPKEPTIDYIKRIIGLPGDRVQVVSGILHINGAAVERRRLEDSSYVNKNGRTITSRQYLETLPNGRSYPIFEQFGDQGPADNTDVYTVPEGHFFALGDNRDGSQDSRFLRAVGFIPAENLVGRAEILFFSFDHTVRWYEVWRWPFAIRYGRLFNVIE